MASQLALQGSANCSSPTRALEHPGRPDGASIRASLDWHLAVPAGANWTQLALAAGANWRMHPYRLASPPAVSPPSTVIAAPVMYAASSEARNA